MRIREIIAGISSERGPVALSVEPREQGLTVIDAGAIAAPELLAAAIRETLARAERTTAVKELPFLRIRLAATGGLELEVADDASPEGGGRMLSEAHAGALPLILEAAPDDEQRIDALLARVAKAAGLEDPELLHAALASEPRGAEDAGAPIDGGENAAAELAYVEASRRATELAREVRAIDDRMTASVVPDWLWIATGFGGAGVFMTVIALLYPHLRIYVVPLLVALSLIGFTAYAARAWRELKTRGLLLEDRKHLRARREDARRDARTAARTLTERGLDPDRVLARHASTVTAVTSPAEQLPAVLAREPLTAGDLRAYPRDRQVILFTRGVIGLENKEVLRSFRSLG